MKKLKYFIGFIIIFLCFPSISKAYICTDYVGECPKLMDDNNNICETKNGKCVVKQVAKKCSDIKPGLMGCANNSLNQNCKIDPNDKNKCVDGYSGETSSQPKVKTKCEDYDLKSCPLQFKGVECAKYNDKCQTLKIPCAALTPTDGKCGKDSLGRQCYYLKGTNKCSISESPSSSDNNNNNNGGNEVDTTIGQIKVITCGGNAENKIPARVPHFIRGLYNTLKILIPIIIIGLGMFDFVKAVVASKESEMDDKKSSFIRRLIAGIIVFFIMAVVQWIFGLLNDKDNLMGCLSCFLSDENACIDAGYVSPGKLDEENNKTPTKQPSGDTNNSVVTPDKEDISSSTDTGSSSDTTINTDNQNNDTQNNNNQNSTDSYNSDSDVSDGSDCKTYSKENCVSSKHSYCTYNKVINKCERNRNWWCALYGANNCPVGKKDSRGSLCQITTTQSGTKVCSGIGVKKCSDYAAFNCPASVEGKKCKIYTQVKVMAGVKKKVQVCAEAAS